MVILLSSHRNVPIRAICLLLLTKQRIFVFYYITEIITTPEVAIQFPWPTMLEYIALLNILMLGKLGSFKKPDSFLILPLRSRTHWHDLKRRGALNVRNLEASLQSTTFDSFTKKMMRYL